MWAADHDMWQPTFIARGVAALEAKPEAVLAYPQSLLVDEDGAVIEEMDDQIDLEQTSALDRYKHLIWRLSICNMIYGVARRDAMVAAGGGRGFAQPRAHGHQHGGHRRDRGDPPDHRAAPR